MQKQLNSDLFGIEIGSTSSSLVQKTSGLSGASFDHILNLDQKTSDLRGQLLEMKDQFQSFKGETTLAYKKIQGQLDHLGRSIKVLEQNDHTLSQQNQQRNQVLAQRLSEYKNIETKLREMMDKHHMILRGYDLKIQNLQNLLNEKESSLISFQAALQEAKNEIARLKRA
jgi:chromosome segregation ATPase